MRLAIGFLNVKDTAEAKMQFLRLSLIFPMMFFLIAPGDRMYQLQIYLM